MGMIGSMTSKGQTTVPKEVRDMLGLEAGTRIEWIVQGDHAIVKPRKLRAVDLAGILHRPGMKPLSIEEMNKAILEAAAEDDARIQREWDAGFAEDDEILFGMMEGAMGKLIQLGLGDTAVEGQIPVLKIQGCAEACFGDKALGDLRSAEEGFILQEQAEEFDMVEILALGLSQSGFDGAMEAKEPEFMGERFDGVDDGHGDFLS